LYREKASGQAVHFERSEAKQEVQFPWHWMHLLSTVMKPTGQVGTQEFLLRRLKFDLHDSQVSFEVHSLQFSRHGLHVLVLVHEKVPGGQVSAHCSLCKNPTSQFWHLSSVHVLHLLSLHGKQELRALSKKVKSGQFSTQFSW
jgi:hypothetical protein